MKGDVHHFIIHVRPVGKARPRFATRKKKNGERFTTVYSTQVTEEGKTLLFILNKWNDKPPIIGAIQADFLFVFDRPKSHFGTGKNADKLKPSAPNFYTSKPDFDNLIKLLADSINGVTYKDDCQICEGSYKKRWAEVGEENRVELTLTELE